MSFQSHIQRWLFEPHPDLKDPLQRQRSAILSLVLLFVPTMWLLFEFGLSAFAPQQAYFVDTQPWVLLVSVISLVLYGFTRTRYHDVTIWLTILFAVIAIFILHVSNRTDTSATTLYYFAVLVFAVGFICTTRQVLAVMGMIYACLAMLAFFPPLATSENIEIAVHVALFVTIAGIITLGSRSITHILQQETTNAQQLYYSLMNAGGQAILVLDSRNYKILENNQAARTLLNYSAETLDGISFLELLTQDARAEASAYWSVADGTPHILTVQQPNGQTLSVEARLATYPAQNGMSYLLSLVDVTEKLLTVQALETSEQRFQQVFNNLYQFMLLLDASGKILEANDVARHIFGLPITAIIERPIWGFNGFEEVSIKRLQQMHVEALEGKLSRGELMFEDRDHQRRIFDCALQPIQTENDSVQLLIFSATDVTDERNLQNRLRDIERRYEALFERSEDAVFVFNTEGEIVSANLQAANFLETSIEEIIGSDITRYIMKDEHPKARQIARLLQAGNKIPVYKRTFQTEAGKQVTGEVSVMSVHDLDGHLRYYQSIVRDATEREEREQMNLRYNLVQARNEMMREFITAASHHFRTPLTTIKASLYLLPRLEDKPEKRAKHLRILELEVERLERVLRDLLLVVRLQRTETSEYQLEIRLSSLVNDLRVQQMSKRTYPNHQWYWDISESRTPIQGNGEYIQRAMQNILENAVLYTPEGGKISVRLFEQDQWAVFEVTDSGIGIDNEDIPLIGQDFFRADNAQERHNASPGLGLSIVRQIMHRHKGAMLLESEPGHGTRVQLIFATNDDWTHIVQDLPDTMLGFPTPIQNQATNE